MPVDKRTPYASATRKGNDDVGFSVTELAVARVLCIVESSTVGLPVLLVRVRKSYYYALWVDSRYYVGYSKQALIRLLFVL